MSNENSGNVLPSDYCCHLFDFAKLAKIYKFRFANSWFDSPMATWQTLTGTLIYRHETLHITRNQHGILFTGTYTSSQILHIYGISVVICGGLPTRQAASNHHKPPLNHRKYAGFGMIGIRKSIVLHQHGLATLNEP